jgi:hypothetical protein
VLCHRLLLAPDAVDSTAADIVSGALAGVPAL